MNLIFHYKFRNDIASLQECFATLEASPLYAALSPQQSNALFLVLDEMVSNVIKYAGTDDVKIFVVLRFDGLALQVHLYDDGPPFNPWDYPPPPEDGPLDALPIGGRGIHIVRKATATRDYRRENDRNHLIMHIV